MKGHYINQKTFEDMNFNTTELINILNHRLTKVENDLVWIKKIMNVQTTILAGIFASVVAFLIKFLLS